jgi:hypothetical protein
LAEVGAEVELLTRARRADKGAKADLPPAEVSTAVLYGEAFATLYFNGHRDYDAS